MWSLHSRTGLYSLRRRRNPSSNALCLFSVKEKPLEFLDSPDASSTGRTLHRPSSTTATPAERQREEMDAQMLQTMSEILTLLQEFK